jgi:hypothetical protein
MDLDDDDSDLSSMLIPRLSSDTGSDARRNG